MSATAAVHTASRASFSSFMTAPEAGPGPGSSATAAQAAKQQTHAHHIHDTNPFRVYKLLISGGLAGAVSRSLTAPIDRLKMLLQVQDCAKGLSIREGMQKMAAEGSIRSYFRGNGANVVKIAPETAMKLTLNDTFKHLIARDPDHIHPVERMMAGGIAGGVAQGILYPLDTIRTRLAVSPKGTYWGILHAAYRIHRDEGRAAFYRGLVPSMIGILPYAGVDIAMFEMCKERLLDMYDGNPPHLAILGAGMVSSSVAQVVSYPLALIRTRLQAQGTAGTGVRYTGMLDVAQKTVAREGWRGLYKGLLPNLLKLAPAAGISWYVFEETKLLLGVDPRS